MSTGTDSASGRPLHSLKRVAVLSACWAPLHLALPAALALAHRRYGIEVLQLIIVAIHALFPVAYAFVADRVRFDFVRWAMFIALNHAAVLIGAIPFLLS